MRTLVDIRIPLWVCAAWTAVSPEARGQGEVFPAGADERAISLYVSTTGEDANPGTQKVPFATITQARDAIRQMKKDGRFVAPVTVNVMGGTYHLAELISLGPGDSGTPDKPVTYQTATGEIVILSGGVPIKEPWTPTTLNGNQVFVTELTGTTDQSVKQVIRIDDPARVEIEGVWSRKGGYLHDLHPIS